MTSVWVKDQGPLNGGFQMPFLVPFCLFWDLPDFPEISPILFGDFRLVLCLFLGPLFLVKHVRGTLLKRSATQSGHFPKEGESPQVGKPPGSASPKYHRVLQGRGGAILPLFAVLRTILACSRMSLKTCTPVKGTP